VPPSIGGVKQEHTEVAVPDDRDLGDLVQGFL
jgi:hypothetical protein